MNLQSLRGRKESLYEKNDENMADFACSDAGAVHTAGLRNTERRTVRANHRVPVERRAVQRLRPVHPVPASRCGYPVCCRQQRSGLL